MSIENVQLAVASFKDEQQPVHCFLVKGKWQTCKNLHDLLCELQRRQQNVTFSILPSTGKCPILIKFVTYDSPELFDPTTTHGWDMSHVESWILQRWQKWKWRPPPPAVTALRQRAKGKERDVGACYLVILHLASNSASVFVTSLRLFFLWMYFSSHIRLEIVNLLLSCALLQ